MADKVTVSGGQSIIYIREDAGMVIPPWPHSPGGLHLEPGKPLVAGEDVTVEMAQRLVDDGKCEIYVAPADEPAVKQTPAASAFRPAIVTAAPATADKAGDGADS